MYTSSCRTRACSAPQTPRRLARSLHGFTLIELLVVISIIAMLIALLLPALKAARETARASVCLSNLRQISIAAFNYDMDANQLPPGRWGGDVSGGVSFSQDTFDFLRRGQYLTGVNAQDGYNWDTAGAPNNDSPLLCPSAIVGPGGDNSTGVTSRSTGDEASVWKNTIWPSGAAAPGESIQIIWSGYASNGSTTPTLDNGAAPSGIANSVALPFTGWGSSSTNPRVTTRRLGMAPLPSGLIMFYDGGWWHSGQDVHKTRIAARHSNHTVTNLAAADGHAEAVPWVDLPPIGNPGKIDEAYAAKPLRFGFWTSRHD